MLFENDGEWKVNTFNTIEDAEVIAGYRSRSGVVLGVTIAFQHMLLQSEESAELAAKSCAIADFAIEQAMKSPS